MKILFAAAISSLLLFASCSEDPDDDLSLIGTWELTSLLADITVDGQSLSRYYIENFGLSEEEAQQLEESFDTSNFSEETEGTTFTFNADGTFVVEDNEGPSTGTWSQTGSTITMVLMDDGIEESLDYEILSQSSSNLQLQVVDEIPEDLNDDGTQEILAIILVIEFERL